MKREAAINPSKGKKSNRVDNLIIRDSNFISKIERGFKFHIPTQIKEIGIDYSLTRDINFILEKLERGYQTKDRYLIIVLTGHTPSASTISRFNKIISLGAQSGYRWTQHVKIITYDELVYNNIGLRKGSKLDDLYIKYNKIIEECFTSKYAQEKLDLLWNTNRIVRDHFKGLGTQLSLQDFLGFI